MKKTEKQIKFERAVAIACGDLFVRMDKLEKRIKDLESKPNIQYITGNQPNY